MRSLPPSGPGRAIPVLLTVAALLAGCAGRQEAPSVQESARDIHSYSRPDRVKVTHGTIDWDVDFDAQVIRGSVAWRVERAADAGDEPLILDARGLTVESVTVDGEPIPWELGDEVEPFGSPLRIDLPEGAESVSIQYQTSPDAAGLQWLSPSQTAGREHPFLFSQAQSILARTFLPCQDSPGVRFTYDAEVRAPSDLTAVMAAEQLGGGGAEPFRFRMPQPIPSYLVAVAVGDIAFRELGPRTGVYAEPSVVDAAAWEFADTEKMVTAVEELYGPYRWERYDLIVLPPSFPFGGMENPRLTFATPTILAGDRSLVSLVAHELAHSWSGNLVTNATWSDFWLNEGFTVYLERRIQEAVYGKPRAEMEAVLGLQDLLEETPTLEPGFRALHNVSLEGRDPDDAFSDVPYEKGYLFLRLLEESVGRERFDDFLRRWFDDNAFQSRTTADFEEALRTDLFRDDPGGLQELQMQEWLYGTELPSNHPVAHSDAFERAAGAGASFASGELQAADLPGREWTTQEWVHMIRSLPRDLDPARVQQLDRAWSLSGSGNSEILAEWLLLSIETGYSGADPALERFLTGQGRRKFLKPLYTALAATPEGKQQALRIYQVARPGYHAISTNTIDDILDYEAG